MANDVIDKAYSIISIQNGGALISMQMQVVGFETQIIQKHCRIFFGQF